MDSLATEMLKEVKSQSKRWFIGFIVILCLWFSTIIGFVCFLNQYDFLREETTQMSGIYNLIDSQGNIISNDITSDQYEKIMNIINNGKNKNN